MLNATSMIFSHIKNLSLVFDLLLYKIYKENFLKNQENTSLDKDIVQLLFNLFT